MLLRITTLGGIDQQLEPAMQTISGFLTREAERVFRPGAAVFDSVTRGPVGMVQGRGPDVDIVNPYEI